MLGVTVGLPDIAGAFGGLETDIARATTEAMRGATGTLKDTLRDDVRRAGLGGRLANTWRAQTYPAQRDSLNPAAWAWSRAPDIIDGFSRGATIVPLGGKPYLWIPSKSVPRKPGSGRATSTKKMTPAEVLEAFRAKDFIILKGKHGRLLALLPQDRGLTKTDRLKRVRKGRLAHGDRQQLVLMFTLVASVTLPRALDLQDAANHAADDFVERLNQAVR